MNIKTITKSKSKTSINNITNNNKSKKIRKKSPKTIDYNKVLEKYGNLLEASWDTSDNTQINKGNNINIEKSNNDSYYDYIIENMYSDINNKDNNKIQKNNFKSKNNTEDNFYFTFKDKMNEVKFKENKTNKNIRDSRSTTNIKEETNNFKNKENTNEINNKLKKTTSMTSKNDLCKNLTKKQDNLNLHYRNNKSLNNIRVNSGKEKQKSKKLNTVIIDNEKNKAFLDKIKEKEEINPKFKEKVMLLLNLCRKYANKFNKLYPLCETSLMSDNNPLNHDTLKELKNTIIQYNNMIFNDGITKIFDLDNNKAISYDLKEQDNELKKKYEELKTKNQKLNEKNESLNLKIIELSKQIKNLKKIEYKYDEQTNIINKLKDEIKILKLENKNKDNTIKNFETIINKNMIQTTEFNGLYNELNQNIDNENIIDDFKDNYNNKNEKDMKYEEDIINKEEKILEKDNNINKYNNFNNLKDKNNKTKEKENSEKISNEIEHLDQEIFTLKTKLKKIIQK